MKLEVELSKLTNQITAQLILVQMNFFQMIVILMILTLMVAWATLQDIFLLMLSFLTKTWLDKEKYSILKLFNYNLSLLIIGKFKEIGLI